MNGWKIIRVKTIETGAEQEQDSEFYDLSSDKSGLYKIKS